MVSKVKQLAQGIALRVSEGAVPREEYAEAVNVHNLTLGEASVLRTEIDAAIVALLRKRCASVADLTDAQVDALLDTSIPGGSQARAWFLEHDHPKGLANVRDVVRRMVAQLPKAPNA